MIGRSLLSHLFGHLGLAGPIVGRHAQQELVKARARLSGAATAYEQSSDHAFNVSVRSATVLTDVAKAVEGVAAGLNGNKRPWRGEGIWREDRDE